MSGRRRYDRFAVVDPWPGGVRVLRDVAVDGDGDGGLTVISPAPAVAGDLLRLDLFGGGAAATLDVVVVESRPVAVDGTMQHAVRVSLQESAAREAKSGKTTASRRKGSRLREIAASADAIGVLSKEVPMRVLNVSASGCLIESGSPLEAGTIAGMRVSVDGREYTDDVRVIRCRLLAGAGATYQIGAELVWTSRPGAASLRWLVRQLPANGSVLGASAAGGVGL